MLLTLVIILVLIWSAVVGSIYSNFLVFYKNFTETENYHKARYASIAAIERAELVIKQREPWYVWSWWWILSNDQPGSNSDKKPEGTGFSYLSKDNPNQSTVFREINSRTNRIPSIGNGNVDKLLATDDSPNYNSMDYENAEVFLLYYDKLYGGPYVKKDCSNGSDCQKTMPNRVLGKIRLPQRIYQKFGNLDTSDSLIPLWYTDDALVDWQLRWDFNNWWDKPIPFTIFATQSAAWGWSTSDDSAIRESNLNNWGWTWIELDFYQNRDPRGIKNPSQPTIVSQSSNEIINIAKDNKFNSIFPDDHYFYNLQLKFSLLNLVLWWWHLSNRYPFLEYYVDFWSNIVSDKYFTIKAEWNFWDYQIDNIIYKPTITESILRSFTTIF